MSTQERQIKLVKLSPDGDAVSVHFHKETGKGGEDGESKRKPVTYKVSAPFEPHKNLTDAFKAIRKLALALLAIELADEGKDLKNWAVTEVKIDGDFTMKQSRAVLTLSKYVPATKKWVPMKLPQVTMYPAKDDASKFHDHEKLATALEKLIVSAFAYVDGEYADDEDYGPLFASAPSKGGKQTTLKVSRQQKDLQARQAEA